MLKNDKNGVVDSIMCGRVCGILTQLYFSTNQLKLGQLYAQGQQQQCSKTY